jgi:Antitoxin MazE-like
MRGSTADRVQKHRAKLRAAGLRPIQIWVPNTRRPGFAKECRRQSRLLHGDPQERDIQSWLAQAADRRGWK